MKSEALFVTAGALTSLCCFGGQKAGIDGAFALCR